MGFLFTEIKSNIRMEMDRYITKEKRPGGEYPQGNQMIAFSANSTIGNNITIPVSPNLYYGACGDLPTVQNTAHGFVNVTTPRFVPNNMLQNPGHIVSGIDPLYLAAYSENLPSITGPLPQQMHQEQNVLPGNISFGSNYQNRNLYPVEKVATKPFPQHRFPQASPGTEHHRYERHTYSDFGQNRNLAELQSPKQSSLQVPTTTRKQSEVNLLKNEAQCQVRSRSEKLKGRGTDYEVVLDYEVGLQKRSIQALHKSGPRAFSGSVEMVLKWHKSLQDIGLLVFYEIVAKCVSVRPGERCAKNIVVRDDNGPAMQVVYYEVDFFLPDLKPPCTIRVIGRMMPGTCRLHAFNVRTATGDDVSTLPRRAAVAAHHVAKLCKEYGKDSDKIITPS